MCSGRGARGSPPSYSVVQRSSRERFGCHSTCHKSINPKSLVRVQSSQRLHRLQIENFLFLPYSSCELLLLQAKRIPNMGGRNAVLG